MESLDETRKIWYDVLNYEEDRRNQLTAEDGGFFMLLRENFYGEKQENFIFYNTNYIAELSCDNPAGKFAFGVAD